MLQIERCQVDIIKRCMQEIALDWLDWRRSEGAASEVKESLKFGHGEVVAGLYGKATKSCEVAVQCSKASSDR